MPEKAIILEREIASIVIVGNLNPAIFHPAWFLANKLLAQKDSEDTEIKLISPVMASMFIGKWLNFEVIENKLSTLCTEPQYFRPMRDFVQGILTLLEHTPVKAIGINFEEIISLRNENDLKYFINKLYNNEKWLTAFNTPDLRSIEVVRGENKEDYLRMTIAPFEKVPYGIRIMFNFHKEPKELTAANIVEILDKQWEEHYKDSKSIAENIIKE